MVRRPMVRKREGGRKEREREGEREATELPASSEPAVQHP
jgi:hypothetical protein